jgi:hypothetical protein
MEASVKSSWPGGRWPEEIDFNNGVAEQHMQRMWSWLSLNWGRLEFHLFATVLPIGHAKGLEWTIAFFQADDKRKIAKVQQELVRLRDDKGPDFGSALSEALDDFKKLRELRNPLVHGLWRRVDEGVFEVQPLRVKLSGLISPIRVDISHLMEISKLMDGVIGQLANLGSEALAYQFLHKVEKRGGPREVK